MKSPKLIFIPGFTLTSPLSKRQNFRCFGVLPGSEFADSKSVLIKNFEEANFSDFKRLVVTLKINQQKYNWPQKTCKPLKNTFPGSNSSVIVMRIEQSEGHSKKRIFFVITNKKFILS